MRSKNKTNKRGIVAKTHAWLGFISSFFILSLAVTGLLLNHADNLKKTSQSNDAFSLNPHYSYVTTKGSIYLATESQLFVSHDEGLSFQAIKTPFSAKHTVAIVESEDNLTIALKNGVLFKTKKESLIWDMMEAPNTMDIMSLSYHNSQLWLTAHEGLFKYDGQSWVLVKENTSPMSLYSVMKALHTGYPPFQWLHNINSMAATILIIILLSGIGLFIKLYVKTWLKKKK